MNFVKKTALLIIDMQNAMFASPSDRPYHGEEVLGNIQALLASARKAGVPVVFVQHTDCEEFEKGTPTWQICPELTPLPGEPVVEKPTRDAFHRTDLHEVLQQLGVGRLVICGMQSEYCVETTCLRAFSMGYEGVLAQDAHSTFDTPLLTAEQIVAHVNYVLNSVILTLKTTAELLENGWN